MGFELGSGAVGNATVGQVLSPATFSSTASGVGVAGTMPENGALGTYTPGTAAQAIPAGHTSGGTVAGDPNLVGANIKPGVSIFGVASTMPNQGSPTLSPGQSIPSGYYGGGSVSGIKVATGTATSGTAQDTFYNDNGSSGTAFTAYPLNIPVPSGANGIVAVFAFGAVSGDAVAGSSLGNVLPDGAAQPVLCQNLAGLGNVNGRVIAGGALSLSTSGIVVPVYGSGDSCSYTVLYY